MMTKKNFDLLIDCFLYGTIVSIFLSLVAGYYIADYIPFPSVGVEYKLVPNGADLTDEEISDLSAIARSYFLNGSIIHDNGEVEANQDIFPAFLKSYKVIKKDKNGEHFIVQIKAYNDSVNGYDGVENKLEDVTLYMNREGVKSLGIMMKFDRKKYSFVKSFIADEKIAEDQAKLENSKINANSIKHSIANM